jgi:ligand-binding sensor domain-containing protein/signal transduction histidine kinase
MTFTQPQTNYTKLQIPMRIGAHFIPSLTRPRLAWRGPLAVCVLSGLLCGAVAAQYRFDHWTTDSGLPHNFVRDILQTRDGYLWLTTLDGLVRYDGVRFTVFDKSNTPGLTSNSFSVLLEAGDGTLWIGTNNSGLTRYRDGVFHTFTTADGLPDNAIRRLYQDGNGELLITTVRSYVRWRGGKFVSDPALPTRAEAWIYAGRSGTRWLLDQQGRLHRFKGGRQEIYQMPAKRIPVSDCYEDIQGNLWIGTDQGVYRWKDGAVTHYTEKDGVPARRLIYPTCEDGEGNMWFGTESSVGKDGGILRFKDGRFIRLTVADGLASDNVRSMYADHEGNLWVGTTDRGLNRMTRRLITTYSSKDGLISDNVFPLYEDRAGDIWIGTGSGLSRFSNKRFTNYSAAHDRNVERQNVEALFEDNQGRLWVDGPLGPIWKGGSGPRPSGFALPPELNAATTVYAIRQDNEGYLWFATGNGLLRFKDGDSQSYTTKDGLPVNQCRVIYKDRQGKLWFGTYGGGLAYFKDGRFFAITAKDGLVGNSVTSLYEDADGVLWVGTYDSGLSRYKDGRFTNYTVETGLFNNGVFCILEDQYGYFWMSCSRGIYRVSKQQLNDFAAGRIKAIHSTAYGKQDGMLVTQCNGGSQPAGIKTRDGKLWFPTAGGVVVIDPTKALHNLPPPPVQIEAVTLEQARIPFRAGVQVRPGQGNLEVQYTGLSFIKPEQVRFRYKLAGHDHDWIEVGTRRTAYYSYLPPGDYTFTVLAANSDGVWNKQGASLRISVLPPFYRTWWFVSLAVLSLIGLIALAYQIRIRQLKRAQAAQEAFARRLIESQETERHRIASELHDGLGQSLVIIKNRALLSLNFPDDHERMTEQVQEISAATSQAIAEMREIAYDLRPYQLDRLGLSRALESMLKKVAASSDITFVVEIDKLDKLLTKELEINLYRIVQESINNIIRHSGATEASVNVKRDAQGVQILIADNGCGFALTADLKLGLGLTGIAERARMLGAKHEIQSTPGKGTRITLRLELQNGHYES